MDIIITAVISLIVGIFIAKYAFFSNRVHELEVKVATLEATKSEIMEKLSNCTNEKTKLEKINLNCTEDNKKLKLKLVEYERKKTILSKYGWDEAFGTWRHITDTHLICNSCINKFPPIETRLRKINDSSHQCTIKDCNEVFVKSKPPEPPKKEHWLLN